MAKCEFTRGYPTEKNRDSWDEPPAVCEAIFFAADLEIEVQPLSATELTHLGRILQGQFGQLEAKRGNDQNITMVNKGW